MHTATRWQSGIQTCDSLFHSSILATSTLHSPSYHPSEASVVSGPLLIITTLLLFPNTRAQHTRAGAKWHGAELMVPSVSW